MKKRLLALVLAVMMVVSTIPVVASAGEVYTDVTADAWYYDNVQYVSRNGLMTGTGEGIFSPNANATRAMVMTILARTAGVDTTWSEPWYAAGLNWAVVNGISDGTDPMGSITREQLAAILYRYAKMIGCDMNYWQPLNIFTDEEKVSDYAVEALEWAVAVGLFEGTNNELMPKATATRAQLAAVLNRYCDGVLGMDDVGDDSEAVVLLPLWHWLFGKDDSIDTADELADALAEGGEIELDGDIDMDEVLEVPAGVEAVLDLKGRSLKIPGADIDGKLTIIDSECGGSVDIGEEGIDISGDLEVKGGTFNVDPAGFIPARYGVIKIQNNGIEEWTIVEAPDTLPEAEVDDAIEFENQPISWDTRWVHPTDLDQRLESVYIFEAVDSLEEAQNSPFTDWIADYYVSVDKPVKTGELVLGGNYGDFGWIGFENPEDVPANTPVALLGYMGFEFRYVDIVNYVKEFACGVADVNNALLGVTITVELRLTDPADSNHYYVVNSTSYTFE